MTRITVDIDPVLLTAAQRALQVETPEEAVEAAFQKVVKDIREAAKALLATGILAHLRDEEHDASLRA